MEAVFLILFAIAILYLSKWLLSTRENKDVTITEMKIYNQTHGRGNVILYLKGTIGVADFVADMQQTYIIKNTQNVILVKNQLNGLFQCANLAMTTNIIDIVKSLAS